MFSDFLAALTTFRKNNNRIFRANRDQKSDISEIVANKTFLKKNFASKPNLEFNFNIDLKSKNNNNNNNFITSLL